MECAAQHGRFVIPQSAQRHQLVVIPPSRRLIYCLKICIYTIRLSSLLDVDIYFPLKVLFDYTLKKKKKASSGALKLNKVVTPNFQIGSVVFFIGFSISRYVTLESMLNNLFAIIDHFCFNGKKIEEEMVVGILSVNVHSKVQLSSGWEKTQLFSLTHLSLVY